MEPNSVQDSQTPQAIDSRCPASDDAGTGSGYEKEITAYELYKPSDMPLLPAAIEPEWVEQTQSRRAGSHWPAEFDRPVGPGST